MMNLVLLDTDIGSHLDDALCLAYLLARDDCEILGITTVGGEADRRAMLASALCRMFGKDAPVLPGAVPPLELPRELPSAAPPLELPREPKGAAPPVAIPQELAHAPQADYLARFPRQQNLPTGQATRFMSETIRAYPKEVCLLAIGPLTNIARLVHEDPGCLELLKALVIMGGVFTPASQSREPCERNTSADPQAARLVYAAKASPHRTVGLDVTRQVSMRWPDLADKLGRDALGPVSLWAEESYSENDVICFSDPLAAATLFDEGICRFERGRVWVDLVEDSGENRLGSCRASTRFEPAPSAGPHEVALAVDVDRFFESFWSAQGK